MTISLHNLFLYMPRNITSYSVTNKMLAAKVLSTTVSNDLSNYEPPDASGIDKFYWIMDKFFDI